MEGGYCTETSFFYRDILETLNKIQHVVKATEFIGQTSGKSSKGQTQKMQQAVLQV
jgi:Fanconi anemia group M protein